MNGIKGNLYLFKEEISKNILPQNTIRIGRLAEMNRGIIMTMSNIWATDKYRQKLELVFEGLNIFEVNAFFEKHRFADFDEATEDNVHDHDVWLMDEASYETFIDHLDNYFTRGG